MSRTGHALAYWTIGKGFIGSLVHLLVDLRVYGSERIPRTGGAVLAMSHLSYLDAPAYGVASSRRIVFLAKVEAHDTFGLGTLIRSHGTLSVRRGESDRDAIRLARETVRNNDLLGMFVEGTRQRHGEPGPAKPGAAMVAINEGVPIVPGAIFGSHLWRVGNFAPVSVAWGEPMRFDETPRNSKGYRAATAEIESEIRRLWEFLRELHELGRPRATPPRREHVPFKLGDY
jgi:1-acyl-sn-glycerol-3-phosphate acyltransferase